MKIFYAIQGTGNGHLSRAIQLYPYLRKYGEVDFFLSGSNTQLNIDLPIKYKSKGFSLYYTSTGGLDYKKIIKSLSFNLYKEARALPLEDYDLIINDFDFLTSFACKLKKLNSIHFGHQASFQSTLTPRSSSFSPIGSFILKNFVKSSDYIGLHFDRYDKNIYSPIIKNEILNASISNNGHVTIYLPQYSIVHLEPYLHSLPDFHFEVFTKEFKQITNSKNITYFPINDSMFTNSLIHCKGIITAGGFETPAEAMYLRKKILCIPILQHYEQECNAAALKKIGVCVIKKIDASFRNTFLAWINIENIYSFTLQQSTEDIVDILMKKYKNSLINTSISQ